MTNCADCGKKYSELIHSCKKDKKCLIGGCNKTVKADIFTCNEHIIQCLWKNCQRPRITSFYCRLHHLAKEANYGYYDTDPTKEWKNKKTKNEFYGWGVQRLRDFFDYCIVNNVI